MRSSVVRAAALRVAEDRRPLFRQPDRVRAYVRRALALQQPLATRRRTISASVDRSIPVFSTSIVWLGSSLAATALITANCRGGEVATAHVVGEQFVGALTRAM